MKQRFPFEIHYVLTEPFAGVYVYPLFRQVLGEALTKKVIIEMNYEHRVQKKYKDWIDHFLNYGEEHINPVLNKALNREPDYPTFIKLVEYGLRLKIELDGHVRDERHKRGKPPYTYGQALTYE